MNLRGEWWRILLYAISLYLRLIWALIHILDLSKNHHHWFSLSVGRFFFFKMGRSFDSNFFNFLDNEPKLVIPNLPNNSGEWSFRGRPSQFPLDDEANLAIFSIYLSQDMHFNCFLVKRASFSCYSSYEITRMISLILDSRNNNAFLTSILSLFRYINSLICFKRSSNAKQYFS